MKKVEQMEVMFIKQTTALIMAVICLVVGFGIGVVFVKMTATPEVYQAETVPTAEPLPATTPAPVTPAQTQQLASIAEIKQVLANDPQNAEAWSHLGNIYFDTNRFEEAIDAYRKHLELNPTNADVWTDMGIMYRLSRRPDEAIRCFDKAMEVDPQHQQAHFNKGVVLIFDLQKKTDGFAVWQELLKINPTAKAPNGQALTELLRQYSQPTPQK